MELLEQLVSRAALSPDAFILALQHSEFAAVAPVLRGRAEGRAEGRAGGSLPLVFLHGMGDSCFNDGMQSLTESSGEYLGVYSTCVPTGEDRRTDTMNGFFMTMDQNVDVFAAKVAADQQLAGGFHCIGLSQGNNICRGYIERYNNPPVSTHLSIHGPVVGVSCFLFLYLVLMY